MPGTFKPFSPGRRHVPWRPLPQSEGIRQLRWSIQAAGHGDGPWWEGPARAAVGLLIASTLSLGHVSVAHDFKLSSLVEARLCRPAPQQAETAIRRLLRRGTALPARPAPQLDQRQAAQTMLDEVWEVVSTNFQPPHGQAFDGTRWAAGRARHGAVRSLAHAEQVIERELARLHDPYARLIPRTEFSRMLHYDASGVGLNLVPSQEYAARTGHELSPGSDERPVVLGVIQGSPAETAGLRMGDHMIALDGKPVGVASALSIAAAMREKSLQGSPFTVKVRGQDGATRMVRVQCPPPVETRGPRAVSVVSLPCRADGRGDAVIALQHFAAGAADDVEAAVRRAQAAGATRLILDLCGNRGGLMTESIRVADLFLTEGDTILRVQGRGGQRLPPYHAHGTAVTDLPLALLVDGRTASAAEVVAGALRDNCRATIAGSRTFGKGAVQSVYELSDGSGLVLTVGKYVTPSGREVGREGIRPDFGHLPKLEDAERVLQACRRRP